MEASADALIAEVCLTYILFFDKPDSLSNASLQEWPLLDYACKHWFEHARRLTGDVDQRVANRLSKKLLTPTGNFAFFNWLRVFEPDRPWVYFYAHKYSSSFARPLYYASYCGLLDATRNILGDGADMEVEDGDHRIPLHAAASQGHEIVVQLLLSNGVDINGKTPDGNAPLHCAAQHGFTAVIRLLCDYGAEVGALDVENATPLHFSGIFSLASCSASIGKRGKCECLR